MSDASHTAGRSAAEIAIAAEREPNAAALLRERYSLERTPSDVVAWSWFQAFADELAEIARVHGPALPKAVASELADLAVQMREVAARDEEGVAGHISQAAARYLREALA